MKDFLTEIAAMFASAALIAGPFVLAYFNMKG